MTNGEVTEQEYFEFLNQRTPGIAMRQRYFNDDAGNLAEQAAKLLTEDKRKSDDKKAGKSDSLAGVFVVADVDNSTVRQLRDGQKKCSACGMTYVLSNPCFEVWLIDHACVCPESVTEIKDAEDRAANLGLTTGRNNKEIVVEALEGKVRNAMENARAHMRDDQRVFRRKDLQATTFAPWTDMPDVVEELMR